MQHLTVAFSLAAIWSQWIWPIAMFVLGLGLVVFVHELGHFLVAKAVGIRVNRFALGLGPKVVGFRRGETEYAICAVPLGGYVAMQGQEDFKPQAGPDADPRAFNNKSVGARFLVISAGVVMNIILAALLFMLVYMVGIRVEAPVVGGVRPNSPAAQADVTWLGGTQEATQTTQGLQPGDRIVEIRGRSGIMNFVANPVVGHKEIMLTGLLARPDDRFTLTFQRHVDGEVRTGEARMGVRQFRDQQPAGLGFGIFGARTAVLGGEDQVRLPGPFQPGDRITQVAGRDIEAAWDLSDIEDALTGEPVEVTLLRGEGDQQEQMTVSWRPRLALQGSVVYLADGSRLEVASAAGRGDGGHVVTLPDSATREFDRGELVVSREPLDVLGLAPRLAVGVVWAGEPADQAGMMPGDVIVAYGDRSSPTHEQLREISKNAHAAGGTNIVVLRDGQLITVFAKPRMRGEDALLGFIPVADDAALVVAGVRPGSPADRAGIPRESTILAVDGQQVRTWGELVAALAERMDGEARLTYIHRGREEHASLPVNERVFAPGDYGFHLLPGVPAEPLTDLVQGRSPVSALSWGASETTKIALMSYMSLRAMITRTVGLDAVSGPLGIGQAAVVAGRKGMVEFVYLLALLSAAVAVFNFLPIPVLDGGHAVYLAIEKVARRPVPPKVLVTTQIIGWVFLLSVFLAVTFNDLVRLFNR